MERRTSLPRAMATGIVTSWPIMRARMLRFSMLTATR
jgi:hypothetical protein